MTNSLSSLYSGQSVAHLSNTPFVGTRFNVTRAGQLVPGPGIEDRPLRYEAEPIERCSVTTIIQTVTHILQTESQSVCLTGRNQHLPSNNRV